MPIDFNVQICMVYSVFLWIPPSAFHYPEIKATDVKTLKLKMLPL